MSKSKEKFDAVLVGIAGSFNAMSLSVYNLKSYAFSDPEIRRQWNIHIIQSPLINVMQQNVEVPKLVEQIIAKKPQIVGFSCYMWNLNVFKEIAKELKKEIPNAWIVWGGPEMSKDYIDEGKYDDFDMDIAISGEGERTFLQFTQYATYGEPALSEVPGLSFREKGSKEHFTINGPSEPFKTLLEVPSPFLTGVVDDEILFRRKMQVNIETQRGCSLRCSYCIYHKDMSKISYSTSDRVIDEVQYVINKGVKNLRFVDANFTSELEHAKNIMRGFIDRKFETKLMFELIPGFIDEEMAALFGEFRDLYPWNEVTLGVGVQTINLEVLRMMRRAIRVDKFEMTFDLIQKYNLYAKIDLIIGLPSEDIESINRTLEYMMDKLRDSNAHLLCCHVMRGLPGTELLDIAKEHGMIFSSKYEPHEIQESPALPRKDLLKCLRRTGVVFRLVNHVGWTNTEFISGLKSDEMSIRDTFFAARDRLQISNIQLIDLIIEGLMDYLKDRESWFTQDDFPYAETWWWIYARREIRDEWILDFLNHLHIREPVVTC